MYVSSCSIKLPDKVWVFRRNRSEKVEKLYKICCCVLFANILFEKKYLWTFTLFAVFFRHFLFLVKLKNASSKFSEGLRGRFMNYHNVRIWFGTWEQRRLNHQTLQCRIMRQTQLNFPFLPHQIKTAVPNWFRRRSFAVLYSSVRFGTWEQRRLNRANVTE